MDARHAVKGCQGEWRARTVGSETWWECAECRGGSPNRPASEAPVEKPLSFVDCSRCKGFGQVVDGRTATLVRCIPCGGQGMTSWTSKKKPPSRAPMNLDDYVVMPDGQPETRIKESLADLRARWYCDTCKGDGCSKCNGTGLDVAQTLAFLSLNVTGGQRAAVQDMKVIQWGRGPGFVVATALTLVVVVGMIFALGVVLGTLYPG